jgi:hypothetical protein
MSLEDRIRELSPEKQAEVLDLIEFLKQRPAVNPSPQPPTGSRAALLAAIEDIRRTPHATFSKEELDRRLEEERQSWAE